MELLTAESFLRRKQIDNALRHYVDRYPDLVEKCCTQCNFSLGELTQGHNRNVYDLDDHERSEKARYINVRKVLARLASYTKDINLDNTFITILGDLEIPERNVKRRKIDIGKTPFSTPYDYMKLHYDKETKKYERNVKIIDNLGKIKQQQEEAKEKKLQKFEEKNQIVTDNQNFMKSKFLKRQETANLKRSKTAEKKKKIDHEFYKKCRNEEQKFIDKSRRYSANRTELLQSKSKEKEFHIYHEDNQTSDETLRKYNAKLENTETLHNGVVQGKMLLAKQHVLQVEQKHKEIQLKQSQLHEENLYKLIDKSLQMNQKIRKKYSTYATQTNSMKNVLQKSVSVHKQLQKQQKSNELEKKLKTRSRSELKNQIKTIVLEKAKERHQAKILMNSTKKAEQSLKYLSALKKHEEFKQEILAKHQKISAVAEDLKSFKTDISERKLAHTLSIQRLKIVQMSPLRNDSWELAP